MYIEFYRVSRNFFFLILTLQIIVNIREQSSILANKGRLVCVNIDISAPKSIRVIRSTANIKLILIYRIQLLFINAYLDFRRQLLQRRQVQVQILIVAAILAVRVRVPSKGIYYILQIAKRYQKRQVNSLQAFEENNLGTAVIFIYRIGNSRQSLYSQAAYLVVSKSIEKSDIFVVSIALNILSLVGVTILKFVLQRKFVIIVIQHQIALVLVRGLVIDREYRIGTLLKLESEQEKYTF